MHSQVRNTTFDVFNYKFDKITVADPSVVCLSFAHFVTERFI